MITELEPGRRRRPAERIPSLSTDSGVHPSGAAAVALVEDPPPRPLSVSNASGRSAQLAAAAAELAWIDAGLGAGLDDSRVGVVVGSGIGALDLLEDAVRRALTDRQTVSPSAMRTAQHAAALAVADVLRARGPVSTVSVGSTSGLEALSVARDWIRLGRADVVVAVGVEAEVVPSFVASAYAEGPTVTVRASPAPAGVDAVPSESSVAVVVESAYHAARRGAEPYAAIAAIVSTTADDLSRWHKGGTPGPDCIERSIRQALAEADLDIESLSAICVERSWSLPADAPEAVALRRILDKRARLVPVYSLDAALGGIIGGATGLFQVVAAAMSMREGVLPQVVVAEASKPDVGLQLVSRPRSWTSTSTLVNASACSNSHSVSVLLVRQPRPEPSGVRVDS